MRRDVACEGVATRGGLAARLHLVRIKLLDAAVPAARSASALLAEVLLAHLTRRGALRGEGPRSANEGRAW